VPLSDDDAPELAVFIGRFQPFHNGHLEVVRRALAEASRLLIVIGSDEAARRADFVPFTTSERREMILASLPREDRDRVVFKGAPDLGDITAWADRIRGLVAETLDEAALGADARVTLIGCSKDRSSYYLRVFPEWTSIAVPHLGELSATPIREAYFGDDPATVSAWLAGPGREQLPSAVVAWLEAFRAKPDYAEMLAELAYARRYREAWSSAPYPPIFVTADAVVIQDGHVLLIRRKGRPGQGQWAIPGGFVEQDEFVVDAALRELEEETGLAVAEADLRAAIVATQVFDAPFRDMRGRMITHATLFHLRPRTPELPKAVGADDADLASWVRLTDLRRETLFDDHFLIIQAMASLIDEAAPVAPNP
jgi:bifunctional NMN adenylyltransferase/nudix hydrolase